MIFGWFHTSLQIGLMLCAFLSIFIGIKSKNELIEDIVTNTDHNEFA